MRSLRAIFKRDLEKLSEEIQSFSSESYLWILEGEIKNTAGNLCLHLVGNLNHFIGNVIGNTGYVRKRELEFSDKNVPGNTLMKLIDDTKAIVDKSLAEMDEGLLDKKYPINVFDKETTYEYFLIHLSTHLSYHLGQINYLRRILDKNK